MSNQVIEVEGATSLEITRAADVSVVGSDDDQVYLMGDPDVEVSRDGDTLRLGTANDLNVRMPRRLFLQLGPIGGDARVYDLSGGVAIAGASDARVEAIRGEVTIANTNGDVTMRAIDGPLRVDHVSGDFRADGCRGAEIDNVSGDLRITAIQGDVRVNNVGSDATLENCAGQVRLGHVGGDLVARNLAGGIEAGRVGGDVRLQTAFAPGRDYRVECGGSADVLLAGDPTRASVRFAIDSGDRDVNCNLPLHDLERQPGYLRGILGAGESTVRVQAGGSVRLAAARPNLGFEGGFEGMMDFIGETIESALEGSFSGMFGEGQGRDFQRRMEELGERLSRQAEQAARRAEEIGRRESEKAARRAERLAQKAARQAQRQSERGWRWGGNWGGFNWNPPPPPPPPGRPPAPPRQPSDEERLVILRMLAEGQISTEDAARLLDALGGS